MTIKFRLKSSEEENANKQPEDNNGPIDGTGLADDEIINRFRMVRNVHHDTRCAFDEEFYGGITNNTSDNLKRHNIESYLLSMKVDSFETAKRIEGLLHSELGIFIGKKEEVSAGRGGAPDSTIVYLAKRNSKGFID